MEPLHNYPNKHLINPRFSLALIFLAYLSNFPAEATKLSAPPLPHESDVQQVAPPSSRFYKGNDYRDLERSKEDAQVKAAKQEEAKHKQEVDESKQAIRARIVASIDANNKAVQLGKQNRWAEALSEHLRAVQLDPSNKQFRINLSAAYTSYGEQRLTDGDAASASHLFRQAITTAPDNALAARKLVEAIRKFKLDPSSAEVRLGLGDQLIAANDPDGALIEYQAAIQLEESARTYTKMGDLAYHLGQVPLAASWYQQALVKNPDYGVAHRQLGFAALAQKDLTQAASELRKAIILDPKDAAAGASLVDLWRKQVAANPSVAENHLGLAGAMQLTGDFIGADSEYRRLEAIDPKNPGLAPGRASLNKAYQHAKAEHFRLVAETLYNQNLKKEALAQIGQAVMLEPRNAYYQFLLGECLEANGDYQGAHQAYLTCVLIDPENNKEAAARMKQMYASGSNNTGVVATNLPAASNEASPPIEPRKDVYEGATAGSTTPIDNRQLTFRTHDESSAVDTNQTEATTVAAVPSNTNGAAILQQITQAEGQKDYPTAINLLRQILPSNLQNFELHHHLAVNLMNTGEISEAISEFRIASALCPSKPEYSNDLAAALAIHKKSIVSDGTNLRNSSEAQRDGVPIK